MISIHLVWMVWMRGSITCLITISIILSAIPSIKSQPIVLTPDDDIQHIIDNSPYGSIIILSNGTYNQSLVIRKSIIIHGMGSTIFNVSTNKNQPAITISGDNVSIYNISLTNSASGLYTTGICITGSNILIENCVIHHTPIAISIWSSYNTIRNCYFHHCKDEGIALIGSSRFNCEYNIIKNCTFVDNCDAIEMQHASNNRIINCIILNNTHSGIDAIVKQNNNNIIDSCIIANNSVHGIYLSDSHNNIITKCRLYKNKDGDIIQTKGSSKNTIDITSSNGELNSQKSIYYKKSYDIQTTKQNRFFLPSLFSYLKLILSITRFY